MEIQQPISNLEASWAKLEVKSPKDNTQHVTTVYSTPSGKKTKEEKQAAIADLLAITLRKEYPQNAE